MKLAKLNLSFSRFTDDSLATRAEIILQQLTNNSNFPTPVPPLTALQTAIANYAEALVNAGSKDKTMVAIKRQSRTDLEAVLTQLGWYVVYLSNGDEVMLTSSGFELSKQPEPTVLEQPGMVALSSGNTTGEMVAQLKKVKGAYSYLYQITPDPCTAESIWQSHPVLASSNTFDSLVPGQKYWVRVGAVGSGSQLYFSPLSSHIAL